MNPKVLPVSALVATGLMFSTTLFAQSSRLRFPAASPSCTLTQRVGLTDITISYSRPGVKGRPIFGGIVPYGQVWRTGANQSTKISFSTPVKLEGAEIPAGTYALYTIPDANEWTIILSKNTRLWGSFGYDPKDDLVRFKVAPVPFPTHIETFTIAFSDIRDQSANLVLLWEKTCIPIHLEVDLVSKLAPQIEAAMAPANKPSAGLCFQAATFYFNHDLDLKKALAWVNTGLEGNPRIAYEMLHLKAQILAKQGDKAGAIAAARESKELAIKAEGPGSSFIRMNEDLISSQQ